MKKLHQELLLATALLTSRNVRIALLAFTIALFVLSAGAPNATIGIGK